MSIFRVRDRRKERRRKEGKWKEIHLQCVEIFRVSFGQNENN